jgi:hypothetical protein
MFEGIFELRKLLDSGMDIAPAISIHVFKNAQIIEHGLVLCIVASFFILGNFG